ncbi:MAG TPA: hypothetical protein VFC78_03695 [Tepidisphaeraceae bacterium]|nr:hypothetical protein [Tepidisphaeraceae bacterium]
MAPLQYVILRHEGIAEPHFDLMFETLPGSELATWQVDLWPIVSRTALTRLKDHRRVYLDYEGPLTRHRGSVRQMARGTCQVEIGEGAVWTIRFLNGTVGSLVIRQVEAEKWEAVPLVVRPCDG